MRPHEAWLEKSLRDLKSARILTESADAVLDAAVYHTQQSAEKALKAFLAFNNQPIVKTHDLTALNDLCVKLDDSFTQIYDLVEVLNPYATEFRYPGECMDPGMDEAGEAIISADKIYRFIKEKIT
jgi:HEPN domain-containing protein